VKRGLSGQETFSFECGRHKVALVPIDGPPYFNGAANGGEGFRTALVPDGRYVIDLSDMECPERGDPHMGRNECVNTWRVWMEQDGR
jgi:hypothetical protein